MWSEPRCLHYVWSNQVLEKSKAAESVFPKHFPGDCGRDGVNVLRVKKRQRRRGESQSKTEDVRWWMQPLITCQRHVLISLSGCCQKKNWNLFLAHRYRQILLLLDWFASDHLSLHSWLFRMLLTVWQWQTPSSKVLPGLQPKLCPTVHPWPWTSWDFCNWYFRIFSSFWKDRKRCILTTCGEAAAEYNAAQKTSAKWFWQCFFFLISLIMMMISLSEV